MGAQLRTIRRRIATTKSMAKITRAQELIASSRIVKAQQRVRESGPYARQITRAISALVSHNVGVGHPLLTERTDSNRVAVLLITSDRGFAGGYNANVIREAEGLMTLLREQGKEPVPYIVGRKGVGWYRFREREFAAEWTGFSDKPRFQHAEAIGRTLVGEFEKPADEGGVAEIHVVYTEFMSMLTQTAQVRRLLPLEIEEAEEAPSEQSDGVLPAYEFEPSAETVLDALLPNYIESRIWHMLLQSAASEHAQRRRAMKSATDNANDVIENLTRVANQARQAEITQEISEIVGGANALAESSAGSE
ncbi:F0F1 ATP synthase subunit gamma [Actinoallomurus purpureus]|uniref:F0F1 ATP synthase subunit gamma n=1 Tax=Actinoallomurus purpureus TaxID=478114 RepID=UPI0020922110|nr:F0F1 ATP synthase subunit gamma [Actinoallomurus purpureus]MCO6006197.1 F0F1 ATP synthase subunit gamma [Actinoallomurus purpureus]